MQLPGATSVPYKKVTFLQCEMSQDCLPEMMQSHNGRICLIFCFNGDACDATAGGNGGAL